MSGGLEVRGVSGIVANIHAAKSGVAARVRTVVQRRGMAQRADTEAEAPKRTGFLASRTRLDFSDGGYTYTVGYHEEDFAAAGFVPYFYYVILGTSSQAANPYLFNVYERHRALLTAEVGGAVRGGIARAGK